MLKADHYRAIFISDVHLGTSACQAEYLLDFLTQNSCDTLYLVGDIIDLLAMRKRVQFTAEHEEVISLVMKKAKEGTRVIYIPGNHDALFRRFAGQTIAGIEVKLNEVHAAVNGDNYFVAHGDEFDGVMRCSSMLDLVGDLSHGFLLRLNTVVNLVRRAWKLPYWSISRAIKQRVGKATNFIEQFEKLVSHRALERKFDGYICGHIHHWQMTYHNQTLYMNDGDWVEHCTALVETKQGDMNLIHWADEKEILVKAALLQKPEPTSEITGDFLPQGS